MRTSYFVVAVLMAATLYPGKSWCQEQPAAISLESRAPTTELIAELKTLLPNAKPASAAQQLYVWRELKLFLKTLLDAGARNASFPQVFFHEFKGIPGIEKAKTPFTIEGDELTIAQGASVKFKDGRRFFFLGGAWYSLHDSSPPIDSCLERLRQSERKAVHDHERKAPPGVHYSRLESEVK